MNSPLGVRVRPARMTDQAALTEVDALAWSADSGFPSTLVPGARNGLFFTTDSPPEAHLVAELDGSVVGYIRLKPPTRLPENAHVIQVQGLAVHPDARGHGAAGSLLDAAASQLRDRGIRKLTLRVLSTNRTAIRLYERHGFAREGIQLEEFLINGRYVDDILMARRLLWMARLWPPTWTASGPAGPRYWTRPRSARCTWRTSAPCRSRT